MQFNYTKDLQSKHAANYSKEKRKYTAHTSFIPTHRRSGNPIPFAKSKKALLADQAQRYAGYTESEMRSMLCRLGIKNPEKLISRLDLMNAMDKLTVLAQTN